MEGYDKRFLEIEERFLAGEIAENGLKDAKIRALIGLACLTALYATGELPKKVREAVDSGASVTEIKETLYHTAPYIGFPRVKEALSAVNDALKAAGLAPEEEDQGPVTP